jgi:phosphoglucosamine mutase
MKGTSFRLFGTSGIRGVVNAELNPAVAMRLGMALSSVLEGKQIVTARDTRTTGQMLTSAFSAGAMSRGLHVTDLGVAPTPVLAYLVKALGAASGAMVTASHNPPEFNGIKLFDAAGKAYGDTLQGQIERILNSENLVCNSWDQLGEISSADHSIRIQYLEMILRRINLGKRWRVALDFGSGAAYSVGLNLLRSLDCQIVCLNAQPDGHFPGRSPEPTVESLSALATAVKGMDCDIGLAYDADADRVSIIDERGNFVDGDVALAAFASYMLRRRCRGVVILPIDASLAVQEAVEKSGGHVAWTKVGDANIAEAIEIKKAIFGGEPCGAWIHPAFHLCPDGILSSVLVLKALEEQETTASGFFSGIKKYPMKRGKIQCREDAKVNAMNKIVSRLPTAVGEIVEVTEIDGIRVQVPEGWVLVRASGTEPAIRITVEARSIEWAEHLFNTTYKLCSEVVRESRN